MTKKRALGGPLALILLVHGLAACVDDLGPVGASNGGAPSDLSEVSRVSQALGGWTSLWAGMANEVPLHVGESYTIFKSTVSGCDLLDLVSTPDGAPGLVVNVAGCGRYTAAASSTRVFVGDSLRQQIYKLDPLTGGAGSPGPALVMTQFAATMGNNITKIVANGSTVCWQDSTGIYCKPEAGGSIAMRATGRTLLGVEGGTLYVQRLASGTYSLRALPVGVLPGETILASNSLSFANWFSFDSNHFYWVESEAQTRRIRRVNKSAGSSPVTVRQTTAAIYEAPLSNGSALYWREVNLSDGTARIRRQNLANGNIVSAGFPIYALSEMKVMADGVYATGAVDTNLSLWALQRTPL